MNSTIQTSIRNLLTLFGAYLIGANFFGLSIDAVLWQGIVGIVMVGISVAWGLITKTLQTEMWQSFLRQILSFAGGIMIANGLLTKEMFDAVLAVMVSIVPWLQSQDSKSQNTLLKAKPDNVDNLTT